MRSSRLAIAAIMGLTDLSGFMRDAFLEPKGAGSKAKATSYPNTKDKFHTIGKRQRSLKERSRRSKAKAKAK